jgi:hypothetical protein
VRPPAGRRRAPVAGRRPGHRRAVRVRRTRAVGHLDRSRFRTPRGGPRAGRASRDPAELDAARFGAPAAPRA